MRETHENLLTPLNKSSPVTKKQHPHANFQKICPFLPYEKGVEPGEEICFFDVPNVGRFGLYICYDMWFPELSRAMVSNGVEVILHPTLTDTCDRSLEKQWFRLLPLSNNAIW